MGWGRRVAGWRLATCDIGDGRCVASPQDVASFSAVTAADPEELAVGAQLTCHSRSTSTTGETPRVSRSAGRHDAGAERDGSWRAKGASPNAIQAVQAGRGICCLFGILIKFHAISIGQRPPYIPGSISSCSPPWSRVADLGGAAHQRPGDGVPVGALRGAERSWVDADLPTGRGLRLGLRGRLGAGLSRSGLKSRDQA